MKFGLNDADYLLLDKVVIKPLKALGAKVYVFGSRATGRNHMFSDIDILIECQSNLEAVRTLLIDLKEAVEESALPIKVDFVIEDDLVQSYRESVLKERIEF